MNAKILVFVICVEAIKDLLLYNLHGCTFNPSSVYVFRNTVWIQGEWSAAPWYLKIQTWYEIDICNRAAPCYIMSIYDVIDWFLIYGPQTDF